MTTHLYILTGASRGMGLAMAEQLLQPGNTLLCISRHTNADLALAAQKAAVPLSQWTHDLADGEGASERLRDWLRTQNPADFGSISLINNAGVIEGRTAGTNVLVFTVTVNSVTGAVTLDQIRAVVHPTLDPNEPKSLSADNLVTVTATITDKDGDTQNATLNIGSNLVFLDDGPSISVNAAGRAGADGG